MAAIRVLVVDDSALMRRLVREVLTGDPDVVVVGTAATGRGAVDKVAALAPDLVTMDVEMPDMDGLAAVRAIRATGSRTPIIMVSTLTERGAITTLEALAAGASDYVTKPTGTVSLAASSAALAATLLPKVRALTERRGWARPTSAPLSPAPARAPGRHPGTRVHAVVVGTSTGGPEALSQLFASLPAPLPVPLLVVQHMPAVFTTQLAARLDRLGPTRVVEAADGVPLAPGVAYVAPGSYHLRVARTPAGARAQLWSGPPVNYCRPSVDVLFSSAARAWGAGVLAVVLTGMGQDGRDGTRDLVSAGALVLAQDEASSVVWGMPGAVVSAGLAHQVLALDAVPAAIAAGVGRPA